MGYTDQFRPPKTKVCNTCKIEKPLKDFYLCSENNDGRTNKCSDCLKKVDKEKKIVKAEYAKNYFTF